MTRLILLILALAAPVAAADVDHGAFDTLLKSAVKDGKLDYTAFIGKAEFQAYLDVLAKTDPATLPSQNAKLAFWINAYNANAINGVLKHWPKIKSVTEPYPDFGFFKNADKKVGGKTLSLNDIENTIIRPTFKDPRVHAALNCASASCPPLAPYAFNAQTLDAQLTKVMKAFILDRTRNQFDSKTGTVKLSQIFNWYKDDFTAAGGVKAYLAKFLPAEEKALLDKAKLTFVDYDWSLNKL